MFVQIRYMFIKSIRQTTTGSYLPSPKFAPIQLTELFEGHLAAQLIMQLAGRIAG